MVDLTNISHDVLLDMFAADTTLANVREEIIRRMKEDDNGFDSEGRSQEELIFTDLVFSVLRSGSDDEEPYIIDIEIEGTLLHEHGMESQMSVNFDGDALLAGVEVGDTVIVHGEIEELGSFRLEVERTSKDNSSYGIDMQGENFYYELA